MTPTIRDIVEDLISDTDTTPGPRHTSESFNSAKSIVTSLAVDAAEELKRVGLDPTLYTQPVTSIVRSKAVATLLKLTFLHPRDRGNLERPKMSVTLHVLGGYVIGCVATPDGMPLREVARTPLAGMDVSAATNIIWRLFESVRYSESTTTALPTS